jgi:membrane protease YdiL (CAAX protease family)
MITWACFVPLGRAWMRHETPEPYAINLAGLSAFGPLLAALFVAGRQGKLRDVFARWRANPGWILFALAAPAALHLVTTAIAVATGAHPDSWLHPPSTPEQLAALVVFPIGEEFGWRGFAHPRMVGRYGMVKGSLLLGLAWGLWHLAYCVTPAGAFDPNLFVFQMLELPLFSVLIAWAFERANRSMAVAIAFHAGAHLDHFEQAAAADLRLSGLLIVVVACAAVFAARDLRRRHG